MSLSRIPSILSRYQSIVKQRLPNGFTQEIPSKFDNIIVAMSSGVDSSLSASLFASYPNARGIYMRNWSSQDTEEDRPKNCDEQDWKDAQSVAEYLNIPIDLVNFEKDYWIDVFEPMLNSYQYGSTPNPDILCNKFVKFGKLNQYLDTKFGNGNYWLVMGHYARILKGETSNNEFNLFRGIDMHKDQSYYLSQVNHSVLNRTLLPMGHLRKTEVREMANEIDLPSATKPDSQGICFVNNSQTGKFKNFLKDYIPLNKGNIITVEEDGKKIVWGQHEGIWSYTIGQKIGISMPQANPKYQGTWFVSEKNAGTKEIVIVKGRDNPKLFHNVIHLNNFERLNECASMGQFVTLLKQSISNGQLKFQYRSLQNPIIVKTCEWNEAQPEQLTLYLEIPQRAMASGQYGCLYDEDRVLGSGPIIGTHSTT